MDHGYFKKTHSLWFTLVFKRDRIKFIRLCELINILDGDFWQTAIEPSKSTIT